jgi:hypothetical protein
MQEFRSWESTVWIYFCPNTKTGHVSLTKKLKKCTLILHDATQLSRYFQSGAGLLSPKGEELENQQRPFLAATRQERTSADK